MNYAKVHVLFSMVQRLSFKYRKSKTDFFYQEIYLKNQRKKINGLQDENPLLPKRKIVKIRENPSEQRENRKCSEVERKSPRPERKSSKSERNSSKSERNSSRLERKYFSCREKVVWLKRENRIDREENHIH